MQLANLFLLLLAAFVLTVPFGIWRVRTRKFSVAWFTAIHLPIPLIFMVRTGMGFSYVLIPLVLIASVSGQMIGGRLYPPREELLKEAPQAGKS